MRWVSPFNGGSRILPWQVVGQLGMWGTLINGIQAASLEHVDMTTASWNGATSGSFWCGYNVD